MLEKIRTLNMMDLDIRPLFTLWDGLIIPNPQRLPLCHQIIAMKMRMNIYYFATIKCAGIGKQVRKYTLGMTDQRMSPQTL